MKIRFALCAAMLSATMGLAACGGGSGPATVSAVPAAPPSPGTSNNATADYGQNLMSQAQYVGPAHFSSMAVDVAMQLRDAAGLKAFAQQVSDPASANFRRYITPQQIGERFGASTSDYAKAATYFASHDLHVGGWPQRLSMVVSGRQADLESAFGTKFGMYARAGHRFVAPMSAPSFSVPLAVRGITNIVHVEGAGRNFVPRLGTGDTYGYSPQQLRKVFDYSSAYNAGFDGTGIGIGIIGTGPIDLNDVPAYGALFNTRVASVSQVVATDLAVSQVVPQYSPPPTFNLSTGLSTPPPVTAPCNFAGDYTTCNPEDGETQLDTEQVAALAPGATVSYYVAYNSGECFAPGPGVPAGTTCPNGYASQPELGLQIADDEIQQIIADNDVDVVSGSYGGAEPFYGEHREYSPTTKTGIGPDEFAALAAEGIAAFFSSGDSGAEDCIYASNQLCAGYPATDPDVTAVGGVTTPMDAMGNLTNAITGWGVATSGGGPQYGNTGFGASGGGCSIDFPMPSWQVAAGLSTVCSTRALPDVSLEADLATGVTILQNVGIGGPSTNFYGGTSVAAPEMAAMWSLVLEACKATASCATAAGPHPYRLGNAAPYFYAIYANKTIGSFTPHLTSDQVFYDVLYGFNGMALETPTPSPVPTGPYGPGYDAGPGYDLVTGIGVPFARHLIKAVVGI